MPSIKVDLKSLRILPALMMAIFAMYVSIDFNVIGLSSASYLLLASTLAIFLVSLLLTVRSNIVHRFDILIIMFLVYISVISIIGGMDWKDWVYYSCSVILLCLMFSYYQHDLDPLLIGALIGFSIPVYAQGLQLIIQPDLWIVEDAKEVSGYILGGNYNGIGCRIMAALLTNILCFRISRLAKVLFFPLMAVSLAILFTIKSMTSLSCILVFLALCLIPGRKFQTISIRTIFIIAILFEVFVCFKGKGFENNALANWIVVDLMGKDLSFTYRTDMWDSALRIISESPLFGYGFPDADWYLTRMSSFAIGPHNMILGILIYGGVIALGLYLSLYVFALARLSASKSRRSIILFAAITMLTFMMLMEVYSIQFILYFLVLAYHSPDMESPSKTLAG